MADNMSKVFQRGFDINDKKWFSNKEIIKLSKAKEEMYLLSTKIFCGHYNTSIVGASGTSKNKTQYINTINVVAIERKNVL